MPPAPLLNCLTELLAAQVGNQRAFDRWRVPLSGQRLRSRGVEAHQYVKRPFWRGKPVCLLVRAGIFVLEIQVERPVPIVLEWHPTADGKSIDGIGDREAVVVIQRDRPEGIDGR